MLNCVQCQTPLGENSRFCSNCGATVPAAPVSLRPVTPPPLQAAGIHAQPATPEIIPGLTVVSGRYRVQALLGQGGMGAVYKCNDLALGETVALKFLLGSFASDPKMIERFFQEIKVVRRIQHKSVVPNYDIGEWQSLRYIVMQYVDGKALSTVMDERHKLPLGEVIPLITQVISGLKAAHDAGIVHRDLKTDNILIDGQGNAFILDFGIARRVDSVRLTVTGEVLGSPLYISPEQAQGKDVDHRADIYSLGVILFELLTGEVPYNGDDALSVALKHVMSPVVSPRALNPAIPAHVDAAIMRCMQKNPDDRYNDATQILPDLLGINIPTSARTPTAKSMKAVVAGGPATGAKTAPESKSVTPTIERVRPLTQTPRTTEPGREKRLLVIDSDEGQILTLKREMAKAQIQVLSTANGQSGAEMAFKENPDAILINARAPVIDGITFAQIMRGNPQFAHTPIFLICDRPDPSIVALQKPLRISGFVVRPLDGQDMLLRLNEVWATPN